MENKISVLTFNESLQQLMALGVVQKNKLDWPVVYSGHVPNVCLIVFDGEILIDKESIKVSNHRPLIVGLNEIINSVQSPNNIVVKKESEYIFFDKVSAVKNQDLISELIF